MSFLTKQSSGSIAPLRKANYNPLQHNKLKVGTSCDFDLAQLLHYFK